MNKKVAIAVVVAVVAVVVAVVVSSGSPDPVDIIVSSSWDGDSITVQVSTNVPDGAIFITSVLEGTDWDDDHAGYDSDFVAVDGGGYSVVFNVADFAQDVATLSITFAPWATNQPESISRLYRDGARLELKEGLDATLRPGPPANPDRRAVDLERIVHRP